MNGLVDLSETTITFCKSTINFVNDALRLHAPELLEVFIDSFGDIFKNMIELYVDAMNRDENTAMMEGIVKDGEFVLDTFSAENWRTDQPVDGHAAARVGGAPYKVSWCSVNVHTYIHTGATWTGVTE